jgi:hypothetical protein
MYTQDAKHRQVTGLSIRIKLSPNILENVKIETINRTIIF